MPAYLFLILFAADLYEFMAAVETFHNYNLLLSNFS
jgi:hypothetical protein